VSGLTVILVAYNFDMCSVSIDGGQRNFGPLQ